MTRHKGFWSYLLYDYDTRRHHEVLDAVEGAQFAADRAASLAVVRNTTLEQRLEQMNREIVMLRTVVAVLAQTLKDTDVIDDRLLDARLEAALDEALAPQAAAESPEPEGAPMVVCRRCNQRVPASTTTMTADGAMCDRCPTR